jgi:hypothetical protein
MIPGPAIFAAVFGNPLRGQTQWITILAAIFSMVPCLPGFAGHPNTLTWANYLNPRTGISLRIQEFETGLSAVPVSTGRKRFWTLQKRNYHSQKKNSQVNPRFWNFRLVPALAYALP